MGVPSSITSSFRSGMLSNQYLTIERMTREAIKATNPIGFEPISADPNLRTELSYKQFIRKKKSKVSIQLQTFSIFAICACEATFLAPQAVNAKNFASLVIRFIISHLRRNSLIRKTGGSSSGPFRVRAYRATYVRIHECSCSTLATSLRCIPGKKTLVVPMDLHCPLNPCL